MFILTGLELLSLNLFQPVVEALALVQADAHRQDVDEYSHHRFNTRQLRRPARRGSPEDDVFCPPVVAKQHRPCSLDYRVERQLVLLCE